MDRRERAVRAVRFGPVVYWIALRYLAAGAFVALTYPVVAVACVVLSDALAVRLQFAWNDVVERGILGDLSGR